MKKQIFLITVLLFLISILIPSYVDKKTTSMKVEVLAYCYNTSKTATGTIPSLGTIAVDPQVIPLGSKENKIDIWFPTYNQCINWGRKKLTITIISDKVVSIKY